MITLEQLNNFNNTLDAIQFAESEINKLYVKAPVKPFLAKIHTPDEVLQYAEKLKQYDKDLKSHKENQTIILNQKENALNVLKQYVKIESCLDTIPKQYQEKVFEFAYYKAKSYGYYEVYLYLCDMIIIFE